ncbi:MAG: vanadium-dependent haloperoxidase [Rubrivivax sp.]|nr:vanadium-dependent haloperoxidase [Rubrivivax sp.]
MKPLSKLMLGLTAAFALHTGAQADAVTDWNILANGFTLEAKLGTPPAMRVMAIVQTAVHRAVATLPATAHDAAVAAANRATLTALLPSQAAAVDAAYKAAVAALADSPAKNAGLTAGERAAAEVLAGRAHEAAVLSTPDATRPFVGGTAGAGSYVPTAAPAATAWAHRTPWHMASPAQFRPAPPPALTSDTWARDLEEVKAFGGRTSTRRSAEQTEIARFWDFSMPAIYHGVLRSVAAQPGRDALANARFLATATQALDDAMISVFEAKYHYNFWRPVTAIRNADLDGHDATQRDATWVSLIDVPMHPEYPSGHSILAGALESVLKAEIGTGAVPRLVTTSLTAKGAARQWTRIEDLVNEIAMARVWGGLHYRFTNDVSLSMGRSIGELAVSKTAAQ